MQRFAFKERKTRYPILLGRKVKELPQIRRIAPEREARLVLPSTSASPERQPEAAPPTAPGETSPVQETGEFSLLAQPQSECTMDAASDRSKDRFRKEILERDQWVWSYPGCNARRELQVHHVEFRSRGGPDEAWNCTVLCACHHGLLHAGKIGVTGRAPHELEVREFLCHDLDTLVVA